MNVNRRIYLKIFFPFMSVGNKFASIRFEYALCYVYRRDIVNQSSDVVSQRASSFDSCQVLPLRPRPLFSFVNAKSWPMLMGSASYISILSDSNLAYTHQFCVICYFKVNNFLFRQFISFSSLGEFFLFLLGVIINYLLS